MYTIGNSRIIIEREEMTDDRLRKIYDKMNQLYQEERFFMRDKRCKKCIHSAYFSYGIKEMMCAYILDTGEPRGCPVGDDCDKFEEKKRARRVNTDGHLIGEVFEIKGGK